MKAHNNKSFFTLLSFLLGFISLEVMAYQPITRPELSNLCVRAISQDYNGHIWIATANGLCKSYGSEYDIYFGEVNDSTTIPSNSVTNLYNDKDGWLLITTNLGACGLEKGTKFFHRFNLSGEQSDFCAYGFIEYAGRLLCYGDRGLYEISKPERSICMRVAVEGEEVRAATEGPDGLLWLSNGASMVAVDHNLKPVTSLKFSAADRVNDMSVAGNKMLLGTLNGLMIFDPDSQKLTPTSIGKDTEIKRVIAVNDSTHLIATGNRGVIAYNYLTGKASRRLGNIDLRQLKSAEINNVYCDNVNNVWVSTFDRGEVLLSHRPQLFNIHREQVNAFRNDFVTRATFDRYDNLWVGTRTNGIGELDKKGSKLKYFNSSTCAPLKTYAHDFVQELSFDSQGRLWAGYNNSLIVCQPEYTAENKPAGLSVIKTFPTFVNVVSIAEDSKGQLWIGTGDNGLFIIDDELNVIKNITAPQLRSNNITKIISYDNRHILVSAYSDNLYLIDITNHTIRNYPLTNQQASSNAIDMMFDKDRNLWIGTYHHGLFRIDGKTKELSACIDEPEYYDIVGLAQDSNGDIWASSSYGLYQFDNNGRLINTYLKPNGLGGNQFHEKCVATKPDGTLLFGGNAGLEEIVPGISSTPTGCPIKLVTKGLWLLPDYSPALKGEQAHIDEAAVDQITLNHKENSLNIEFFAINYDKSTDIEYAYMLKGRDKDFIYTANHPRVSYSDLSAGKYDFMVKARYKGYDWQDPQKLLSVEVKPNPWLSTPANIIYILILLSILIGSNRMYLRFKLIKQKYALSEERIRQEKRLTANRIHFFTNISHELRTPLTLICGPAKHLRDNYKSMNDNQIKQSFDFIDSNIERLLTLINQLLSFRSVNGETLPLQVAHNDIAAQLESLAKLYNVYASENRISIGFENPADEHSLLTYDSDKVEKIVSNLVINAIKYSKDKGEVTITLTIEKHPEGLDTDNDFKYICIAVKDNGRGMEEEDIPKIFQPFKRLLGIENEKKIEGFGIGLHFVQQLVKEHKGMIRTCKNPGGGMTFTILLPASDEAFTASEFRAVGNDDEPSWQTMKVNVAPCESECDDETGVDSDESRPKILVVDDNLALNEFIATLFSDRYTIVQACDGAEGLQKATEECPDIIISDIRMPGEIDGYSLCRQIKSDPSTSHISVVLLTAKTLDENKIQGYQCGADAYLCKPFSPEVLKACVDNLNAKRMQQASMILASAGLSDQPEAQPKIVADMSPLDKKFLEKLYAYIEDNLDNCDLNVNMLGRELGFSRTNFYRKVKALTGISPTDLLRVYRLNRAAELLLTREYTVGEVGEKIGFGSQSHFSSLFKKHFGVSPRAYVTNHFSQYCPTPEE